MELLWVYIYIYICFLSPIISVQIDNFCQTNEILWASGSLSKSLNEKCGFVRLNSGVGFC